MINNPIFSHIRRLYKRPMSWSISILSFRKCWSDLLSTLSLYLRHYTLSIPNSILSNTLLVFVSPSSVSRVYDVNLILPYKSFWYFIDSTGNKGFSVFSHNSVGVEIITRSPSIVHGLDILAM